MISPTGRIVCTLPNLQRIAKHTPEGQRIKEVFRKPAPKDIDYAEAELRVIAHQQGEKN